MGNLQLISFVAVALGLGAMISVYTPMISSTSAIMGSPIAGSVVFFSIALAASVALLLIVGDIRSIFGVTNVPAIYMLSGVLSAFVIFGVSLSIPVLGLRRFIILMIAGQIFMSVIAGHFGLLGVPRDLLTPKKAIGLVLVIVGVYFTVAE